MVNNRSSVRWLFTAKKTSDLSSNSMIMHDHSTLEAKRNDNGRLSPSFGIPTDICGTDSHIHEGEFVANFPVRSVPIDGSRLTLSLQLIPGHEVVGTIEAVGKNVKGFREGDRCVADLGWGHRTSFFVVRLKINTPTATFSANSTSTADVGLRKPQ